MALGAFLAGIVVGQSDFSARAAAEALPMRDAFAVLFFVSVGMLFNPATVGQNMGVVAATLCVVLVGKPLVVFLFMRLLRHPMPLHFLRATSLAQIGEFSFVIATMGRKLEVLSDQATQAIVVTSMVSITLNPLLFRSAKPLARTLDARRKGNAPRVNAPQISRAPFPKEDTAPLWWDTAP